MCARNDRYVIHGMFDYQCITQNKHMCFREMTAMQILESLIINRLHEMNMCACAEWTLRKS